MKRFILLLLCAVCALALCGCYSTMPITESGEPSSSDDAVSESSAQVTNPVREVNAEELCTESGLTFVMPIGAEDVHCSVIEGEPAVYEMSFTLNGKDCAVRAAYTDTFDASISGVEFDSVVVGDGATSTGDPTCFYIDDDGFSGVYYCYTGGVTWSVYMTGGIGSNEMESVLRTFVPSL